MKTKNILFIAIVVTAIFSFSFAVNSITPFRGFVINVPSEVDVQPGQTVTVNGSVQNIGLYWEHNFTVTLSGLSTDFQINITPNYWPDMMTIRAWNPVQGLYKVPVPFNMTIVIPDTASGVYAVNVTGQEHQSWRSMSNSSIFILKVGGNATNATPISTAGVISISDLIVPDSIEEFKPFNVTFNLLNSGNTNQTVNISLQAPSDWTITAKQSLLVLANGSTPVIFSAIPTSTAGNLAVVLEYPYQQTVINVTKSGPYLIPTTTATLGAPAFSTTALLTFVQQNSVLTIIIAVVILILIWYFFSTYSFYSKRKEPEEMKKQIETPEEIKTMPKLIETSPQDEAIVKQ